MIDDPIKAPWHIWLVGVIAVLFNAIGVFDFVMFMARGEDYLASAGMTADQIDHYRALPVWVKMVWAIGVFGALLASVLLLLRKNLAASVFALSLTAFLINLLYSYGFANGGAVLGRQMAITSIVIAVLLLFFTWYARTMSARRVLR